MWGRAEWTGAQCEWAWKIEARPGDIRVRRVRRNARVCDAPWRAGAHFWPAVPGKIGGTVRVG